MTAMELPNNGRGVFVLMFDSMVWDEVLVSSHLEDLLLYLEKYGHVGIVRTHVQMDQNEAMRTKNQSKLMAILGLRARLQEKEIVTEGFVLGVSRFGQAKLGSDELTSAFQNLMGNQKRTLKHAADTLLAVTAGFGEPYFVTGDKRLEGRAGKLGFKTIPLSGFEGWLGSLLGPKS